MRNDESEINQNQNGRRKASSMTAKEIVRAILQKYSSIEHNETHCRMSDLEREFTRIIEGYESQLQQAEEHHEAWLRIQRLMAEESKPLLQRLFG